MESAGSKFDDQYCCPHTREENCECRKPKTGLLRLVLRNFPEIDLKGSFMIGDRTDDIQIGNSDRIAWR